MRVLLVTDERNIYRLFRSVPHTVTIAPLARQIPYAEGAHSTPGPIEGLFRPQMHALAHRPKQGQTSRLPVDQVSDEKIRPKGTTNCDTRTYTTAACTLPPTNSNIAYIESHGERREEKRWKKGSGVKTLSCLTTEYYRDTQD